MRLGGLRLSWIELKNSEAPFFESLLGPLSLLCTLSLALQRPGNTDCSLIVILGLIAIFIWQTRGFVYSLFLLALFSLWNHCLYLESHLWRVAVEGSLLLGFAITTMAMEGTAELLHSMRKQEQEKESSLKDLKLSFLEIQRERDEKEKELSFARASFNKEKEASSKDLYSIYILNDVLRKKLAEADKVSTALFEQMQQRDCQLADLACQIEMLQQDGEAQELQRECERLEHQKEELLQKINELQGKERHTQALFEQTEQQCVILQEEVAHLEDLLSHLEKEKKTSKESDAFFQKKIFHLEKLYTEMKKQFQDKKEVLHQTRIALFRSDTQLQAKCIEQSYAQFQKPILEEALIEQFIELANERERLAEESGVYMELITHLNSALEKKEKRSKKQPPASQVL